MASPLLELKTETQRKHITIDGKAYELRNSGELSLMDLHHIESSAESLRVLKDTRTEEDVERAEAGLRKWFLTVLVGSESVVDKLSAEQKLEVLNCFLEQSGTKNAPRVKRPRVSSVSMEVVPKSG